VKTYAPILLSLLAVGCKAKDEAPQPTPAASASAAAAAPPAETAATAEPGSMLDTVKAASTAAAPTEPNAPPPHDAHERAAATEIHKGNYKSQLESLEKEDLSGDRKR
jgi:hypothetical protein